MSSVSCLLSSTRSGSDLSANHSRPWSDKPVLGQDGNINASGSMLTIYASPPLVPRPMAIKAAIIILSLGGLCAVPRE
jgi:hypothetical protein